MTELAQNIVGNVILQAIAIITAVAGAIIFLWKNRRPIISIFLLPANWLLGKISVPYAVAMRQIEIGLQHPSYYVAVLVKHLVVLIGFFFLWYIARDLVNELRRASLEGRGVQLVILSLSFFANVCALIIGSRLGELWFLTTRLIRGVESDQGNKT